MEEEYPRKLAAFVRAVLQEQPDIMALQEVNQTVCGTAVSPAMPEGYFPCTDSAVIRQDHHVYRAARMLREEGCPYFWTWLPLKLGYAQYDEGIAVMSRSPILETEIVPVSRMDDYRNWKTRKLLGIRTEAYPEDWFYSVHYGWWDDAEEPFPEQWQRTQAHMQRHSSVWLMGDFNNPAGVPGEGYDMITRSGWYDTFVLAEHRDSGETVGKIIDGWGDKLHSPRGMRIDQIWCSRPAAVSNSRVLFNGAVYPVVSDHYGLMIDAERS